MKAMILVMVLATTLTGCYALDRNKKKVEKPTGKDIVQLVEMIGHHSCGDSQPTGVIELHGCSLGSPDVIKDAWIKNNTNVPVRVLRAENRYRYGEQTKSMTPVYPGTKLSFKKLFHNDEFYIYSIEGGLIGWFPGRCPSN